LVELLVVIAIIGILVALLLPAIQAAREAARRATCTNQVKQIALAWHLHHDTHKYLPSGGWGYNYMADPDRGTGAKQPGSWAYSCLPYLEEQAIHQIGAGITGSTSAAKKSALTDMSSRPVAGFYCPTRRPPNATPNLHISDPLPLNYNHAEVQARSDYAANLGPAYQEQPWLCQWQGGPASFTRADQGIGFLRDATYTDVSGATKNWMTKIHGIVFQAYEYNMKEITDGTAQTYLVGEKFVRPDAYNGELLDIGDDQPCWAGDDLDLCRFADDTIPPVQDQLGLIGVYFNFGSAHVSSFQMAMCDASVQNISYDIDPITHERLGGRRDGEVTTDF
jgi:hypothetical protein